MSLVAFIAGYLIGSVPTANGLARLRGVDLREGGSGNPGATNARRLAGNSLAAAVLIVEITKGWLAVVVGTEIGGDLGAVLGGLGAVAGNVYNVWYGFSGGKGLAIAGGVVMAAWPLGFPPALAILIGGALLTRSSGRGALLALISVLGLSVAWWALDWPDAWGVEGDVLVLLAVGLAVMLSPKHLHDAVHPVS